MKLSKPHLQKEETVQAQRSKDSDHKESEEPNVCQNIPYNT